MNSIKTVDDLIMIKNLTPDEKMQFKDLIEESKEREKIIEENMNVAKSNLNQLMYTINMLGEKTSFLGKALDSLLDELETLRLKLMPSNNFYRE